jgi:hypothetical protein
MRKPCVRYGGNHQGQRTLYLIQAGQTKLLQAHKQNILGRSGVNVRTVRTINDFELL